MADCREQRAAVKFCFLLGKSAAETIVMLKTAYGDAALSKTRVYEWFSRFAKFVPHLLTGEQRERRLQACFEL